MMAESRKEEEEAKKTIAQIGKQLSAFKTCPNKGALVKILKQASLALPELKQSEQLKPSVKPLGDSLFRLGLFDHKDKDVRILVGTCLCEVIRILAPNPDFSHSVFRDIFKFLLGMFGELDDTTSPYFSRKARVLEMFAKLRFYLVMLDIGCEDLVLKMFRMFFSVVRDDHPHFLINSMASIITSILEEKVETDPDPHERSSFQSLLDVILQNVLKERKGVSSASFQLAVSVIKNCGDKLGHYISQFLTYCILNREVINSAVKESYHEIILEVFQIAPQMLLSVIPNLTNELLTDQVDVRIRALNIIRKLLALRGQHVAREYPHIFVELLNRFSDKSADVRLAALSCAKALYLTSPSGRESDEMITAIQGRLLDHDDKVRVEAVNVVCDITKANLNFKSSELITQATERLRDKKASVRSKVLKKLLELYHEYCTRFAAGTTLNNDTIEEIPCKFLMLCYEKHCPEFRPQNMDFLLADLFPASLSIEERTKHWVILFSLCKPPHIKALKAILSKKRRLHDGLKDYLALCSRVEENGSIERERKMEALVGKMSLCFPDPAKAKDCFQTLKELKDNRIMRLLQKSLTEGSAIDLETMKDVCLRELGDLKDLSEFLHLLCTKCSFNIFGREHVHYIIDCLSSHEASKKQLLNYQVELLLTIISAFPSLLRGSEKQFQLLLVENEIPFNEQLLEILALEGHDMSIELSDIYTFLEKICLEGTHAQAKLAVSAIAALSDTSEQLVFSQLCKALVDALYYGCNTSTILQSIGCMAQHSVPAFEAQEKAIIDYIVEEIFQHNDVLASKDLDLPDETTDCCASCKLKIIGLKTLVRSFLPHKQTPVSRPVSFVLNIIQQMLQKSGYFAGSTCGDDEFIRLAAAKSVLRLSRKWDLHISPDIFHLTILTAKDHSAEVRRALIRKIHKLLNSHTLPSRYACAFSFVAVDSLKDLHNDAMKYLEDFIRNYDKGAQMNQTRTMQGPTNHPAYLVVHLIHVLAHDSNFPDPDCRDGEKYAQVLSPFFVTVQALVSKISFDSNSSPISNVSTYLRSIFHAIKKAEDAVDVLMTPKLHLLAEMGISILDSLNTPCARENTPRSILLPSSLYKSVAYEMNEVNPYLSPGSDLDTSFVKNLVSWLKIEVSRIDSSSTHHGQQLHENSSRPSGTRQNRPNPKSDSTNQALTNKTKQTNEPHAEEKELDKTPDCELDAQIGQTETKSSTLESVVVQEDPSTENGQEIDAWDTSGSMHSSYDHVIVEPSLSQKEILLSSRDDDDEAKILGANRCNSNEESLPKNRDNFAGKHSQAVKRTRQGKDASSTSVSEVVNFSSNNIGVRTRSRRQKV